MNGKKEKLNGCWKFLEELKEKRFFNGKFCYGKKEKNKKNGRKLKKKIGKYRKIENFNAHFKKIK